MASLACCTSSGSCISRRTPCTVRWEHIGNCAIFAPFTHVPPSPDVTSFSEKVKDTLPELFIISWAKLWASIMSRMGLPVLSVVFPQPSETVTTLPKGKPGIRVPEFEVVATEDAVAQPALWTSHLIQGSQWQTEFGRCIESAHE